MTTAPDFMKHGVVPDTGPPSGKWKWILALGALYVIVGVLALSMVVTATFAGVLFVGLMMIIAGIAQIFNAFQMRSWGGFFLWLALGVLYVLAGIAAFDNPLMAAKLLTLLLGVLLVATGVVRLVLAFSVKSAWAWVAFSALVTLALGVVILAHWPWSSLFIIGMWLGIDLIFSGMGWIRVALGARRLAGA